MKVIGFNEHFIVGQEDNGDVYLCYPKEEYVVQTWVPVMPQQSTFSGGVTTGPGATSGELPKTRGFEVGGRVSYDGIKGDVYRIHYGLDFPVQVRFDDGSWDCFSLDCPSLTRID